MEMINSIKLLQDERKLLLQVIDDIQDDELLKIPEGSNNNILWNLGHILVTQQVLCYTLSRAELRIEKNLVSAFRTGTSPSNWDSAPDINEIKSLLIELPDKFADDFKNGIFKEFRSYKTMTGFQLNTVEDAVTFNHYHEGTHMGIILGIKKVI